MTFDTPPRHCCRRRGTAPELLADLLGHVDTRMVFKHYRHPVTPTIEVAAVGFDDEAMEL